MDVFLSDAFEVFDLIDGAEGGADLAGAGHAFG